MDSRTRSYLEGRFGDHYRRSDISLPPAAHTREWGYIPWTGRSGTTMVRHRSLAELGNLGSFLEQERPRHVYYSAGRYEQPAASRMGDKEWGGSDLIFDLDADHLPGVDPDEDAYADMLARCKRELQSLLSFLEDDFGFEAPAIVFSGGRGYHVHVREPAVRELNREARREIVDYVRGHGVEPETVLRTQTVAGVGRQTPAEQRRLDPDAGWSRRVHREVMRFVDELRAMDEDVAHARLREFEGIGEGRAAAILDAIDTREEELRAGNVDVHPAFSRLMSALTDQAGATHGAAIDEPVTTDLNRLIRLPGSLHGGSGLTVTPIDRDDLDAFDPLVDAIPSTFQRTDIAIELHEHVVSEVGGDTREFTAGTMRVPEFVGIHLMASDRAEKASETAA